jgi:hypothetical protein
MNKHFEDARYYLGRASEHAKEGVLEELEPIEQRFKKLSGGDEEPEPSRLEKLQQELTELETRAEGDAKQAIRDARDRIRKYRDSSGE